MATWRVCALCTCACNCLQTSKQLAQFATCFYQPADCSRGQGLELPVQHGISYAILVRGAHGQNGPFSLALDCRGVDGKLPGWMSKGTYPLMQALGAGSGSVTRYMQLHSYDRISSCLALLMSSQAKDVRAAKSHGMQILSTYLRQSAIYCLPSWLPVTRQTQRKWVSAWAGAPACGAMTRQHLIAVRCRQKLLAAQARTRRRVGGVSVCSAACCCLKAPAPTGARSVQSTLSRQRCAACRTMCSWQHL